MRILIDLGHPGHVHFFKHAIRGWREGGHSVLLTARDKDVTLALLERYGLEHRVLSGVGQGQRGLVTEFVRREYKLWQVLREFRPHVVTAIGGAFIAPVCKLAGIPSVVFTDSEHVALDRYLTYPLASAVCTPRCFKKAAGPRQVRYRGFQELAYLDPGRFTPDPRTLAELDLTPQSRFALLRFVAWGAGHDIGHSGFTAEGKARLVHELARRGRVLVSVEGSLPREFERYALPVTPDKVHDLLHYASLYVGEGATMATEAALLGTPAIYLSSLAGTMGNYEELARYGLVEAYRDEATAIRRALALMDDRGGKAGRQAARERMLGEMIDVTAFLMRTVESYA
jgi:predicted glycosyltransferase